MNTIAENKAYDLLSDELAKIEKEVGYDYTHCENVKYGNKLFSYYVIFNDGNDNLTHFTFTVNIKTKEIKKTTKRII